MPDIRKILEGKFARVGLSLIEGAVVTFIDEGRLEENTFDDDETADERLTIKVEVNGEKKLITPNLTSMRELGKVWGTHTKNWIGKKARVTVEKKQVFGEWKQIAFFHPVNGEGEKVAGHVNSAEVSPEAEELIMELEMCETSRELNDKLGELSARINKLSGNDKVVFLREKLNVEARFSARPEERTEELF